MCRAFQRLVEIDILPPMTRKNLKNPSGGLPWLIIIAAIVILLLITLTATVVIQQDDDHAAQTELDSARAAALASKDAPSIGNPNAPVHIVEFLDPACETCALFYPMVKQWLEEVPDKLRLSVRHVPFHDGSEYAVQVLEAARAQGLYWETLEALLASQRQWTRNHTVIPERILPAVEGVGLNMERLKVDMNGFDVRMRMEQDKKDAVFLKVSATPEYFVNGRPLPSFGQQQLLNLVREELANTAAGSDQEKPMQNR
jgi:protein-disulfide isomerase